ncbi:hypothetical protein ACFL2V_21160 [Pseudomonadota bacterium]
MNLSLHPVFVEIAAWLGFIGAIYGLIIMFGSAANEEVKRNIGDWLSGDGSVNEWHSLVIDQFDSFFDDDWQSNRFLNRSILVSISLATILLTFSYVTSEEILTGELDLDSLFAVSGIMLVMIMVALVSNTIPDYLSLIETRLIMGAMKKTGWVKRIILLKLDILFTFYLFSIAIIGWHYAISLDGFTRVDFRDIYLICPWIFYEELFSSYEGARKIVLPLLLTTFLTSIWLWGYFIGGVLLRTFSKLRGVFDIQNKPVESIGVVAAGFSGCAALLISMVI